MKRGYKIFLALLFLYQSAAIGQTISSSLPVKISNSEKYLFYLHGGVVTVLGNNAINQSMPEWGPYEYFNILDSLRVRGFNVISENRKDGVADSLYVQKIINQVDSLFKAGVRADNIVVVGASAGWDIGIRVSAKLKNRKLNYVLMGGCWPATYKDYTKMDLYGHFLSIIESTDPHGTCMKIFEGRKNLTSVKEIMLHTGMSHGFFYKGYRHWIDPVVEWYYKKK